MATGFLLTFEGSEGCGKSTQIQRLRAQMENEPLTAEEDAEIARVIEATFTKRFPQ